MIPRVDAVYRDQSAITWKETISCQGCGTTFVASVLTVGHGTGRAVYGIGRQAASERAGMDSFINATEEGERLIRLKRCSRCRKSLGSTTGVTVSTAIRTGVGAFFLGPGLVFPTQWGSEALQQVGGLLMCPAFFGVWFGLYRWQFGKRVDEADQRVRLEPVPGTR